MSRLTSLLNGLPRISSDSKFFSRFYEQQQHVELHEGDFWRQDGAHSLSIRCLKGSVWITAEGNYADNIISEGEDLLIRNNGLVVIEALADTQFDVSIA